MAQFKIVTDTTADLPKEYINEHNLGLMCLRYIINGETYGKDKILDDKEFYSLMRAGDMPTTSQVNPDEAKELLEEYLKESKEILCISFSSGLSGTYNSARLAAEELMEERDDIRIVVIDSKCASLGEGLLVHKAVTMREEGKSFDEVCQYVKETAPHLVHIFTVDDLNHLYRGGRVSKTTAFIGTLANIKPILHVDEEGKLIPISKVRGRKKSLYSLVDFMEKQMGSFKDKNTEVFISHGDCEEDAKLVAEEIKNRFGIEEFLISYIGPTIGAHAGPGTVALFFLGDKR